MRAVEPRPARAQADEMQGREEKGQGGDDKAEHLHPARRTRRRRPAGKVIVWSVGGFSHGMSLKLAWFAFALYRDTMS
ncbi:MAG: hypothetical protein ACI9LT_003089 [Pseudoalteromonas distincta]